MDKDIVKRYEQNFYKIMAENFGDEIYVTDGEGYTLFVNPAAVKVIGRPLEEIIGRNVAELVEEGFFSPSASLEAIKAGHQVDIIQHLSSGKDVLCSSVPIYDEGHERIRMVISTTKDVSEIQHLINVASRQEEELRNLKEMAFEEVGLVTGEDTDEGIKGLLQKFAPLDVPVMINGETGVGKEVIARAIHRLGKGKDKPFVKINCAIIPENLIESELFGYEKGAFTGAQNEGKKGKVELAEGGTLFLDEIGEMPLSMQVKLLDFLQDGAFTRLGGTERHFVSTRLITATNRNLPRMCEEGTFRSDLYYRINVVPFYVKPLRDRPKDIKALSKYFLSNCNSKYRQTKTFSSRATSLLMGYQWPGNVRELEHLIEHAYIMADGAVIGDDVVGMLLKTADPMSGPQDRVICKGLLPLKQAKLDVEKILVERAYSQLGSTYRAAEVLGVDQSTVAKLLKKHHIDTTKG